jgi:hypothetical protein
MKFTTLLITLAALTIPALHPLHAQTDSMAKDTVAIPDVLLSDKVTVTGNVFQETGTNGKPVALPITISNVLKVLAITTGTIPVKSLCFCNDDTTKGIVIVPKSVMESGSGVPMVYFGGPSGSVTTWNPTLTSKIAAGDLSAMDDNLTGAFYQSEAWTIKSGAATFQFAAYGKINGVATIAKGTIRISKKFKF